MSANPAPPGRFPIEIPFLHDLGVEFIRAEDGESEIVLDTERRHLNSWQVVHGGVTMTLLDVAMAMAGRSLDPDARGGVTVEMKTSFLRPGRGRLTARGHCFHRSSTMAFCEASVVDEDGALVAKGMGTFKFIKRLDIAAKKGKS